MTDREALKAYLLEQAELLEAQARLFRVTACGLDQQHMNKLPHAGYDAEHRAVVCREAVSPAPTHSDIESKA